jgi:hypothetical protein
MNANWFQIVMLAYNLNCWLLLFHRKESEKAGQLRHTTLATARLQFLFLAARSGDMLGEWASAIATTTRSKASSNV